MSLADAISEALANADSPPPNESTTCEWVIYPLLLESGYARREIVSRIADNNGQFPDYTILPNTPYTWFLEAKAWNVPLEDRHAQQSLNYANQNGKRWVVLTNGQEWRLYDNLIQGVASDKLVAGARLDDAVASEELLAALSKMSVSTVGIERFAEQALLKKRARDRERAVVAFMDAQLNDDQSEIATAVWDVVRRQPGLSDVTRAEVANYLNGRKARPISRVMESGLPAAKVVPTASPESGHPLAKFWRDFRAFAQSKGMPLYAHAEPWANDYFMACNFRKIGGAYYVCQKRSCRVIAWFYNRAYEGLQRNKAAIDAAFGAPLSWDYRPERDASYIVVVCGEGWSGGEQRWREMRVSMTDSMDRLMSVLSPYVERLRA